MRLLLLLQIAKLSSKKRCIYVTMPVGIMRVIYNPNQVTNQ